MAQARDISGGQLYKYAQLFDAPEFVKQADSETLYADENLPPNIYADPVHRLYSCHTPAATWASTAAFLDKRAFHSEKDIPTIEERLAYYARYHGITNSIKSLHEKHAAYGDSHEETADTDYALVTNTNGQITKRYPIRNAAETKTAAAYLYTHRDSFPYTIRYNWANKVLQKAAIYGCGLDEHQDYISRQAGYGNCTTKAAVELLRDRVNAARKGPGELSNIQLELRKLAESVESSSVGVHTVGLLVKLAEIVDDFDRATGLHRQYGDRFKRAEDALFELTNEKMAGATKAHVSTTTGNIYKLADISKLSLDSARSYMGDEFVDAVATNGRLDDEKMAAIIPTLDRGTANIFDSLMTASGLIPTAKEAGVSIGFDRDALLKLAEYRHRTTET